MTFSVIEREAMAILESFRRFSILLRTSLVLVRTDQKALSFIFGPNSSRVKTDKLIRCRLELSEYKWFSKRASWRLVSISDHTAQL